MNNSTEVWGYETEMYSSHVNISSQVTKWYYHMYPYFSALLH